MLAQIALVVFGLFGVLALVVDVGYARLSQAQMQQAADVAALEGLRLRDIGVIDSTGQAVNDGYASDCLRRASAHRLARLIFDDEVGRGAGGPGYQAGAGPVIDLTGGVGSLHALQLLSVPDAHAYDPLLQLNQQNVAYGDMVSGRFCYSADPSSSEGLPYDTPETLVCGELQRGAGTYARNDFNPSVTPPEPPAALPTCPAPDDLPPDPWPLSGADTLDDPDHTAFLVRLRRSNELIDEPGQTEPDVATSGPSLPLLFGRGTVIQGDDPEAGYSVRRDGLTVRATAIAAVRPALQVGLPFTSPVRPGVTPFVLRDTFVQTLTAAPTGTPLTVNPMNGVVCTGLMCGGINAPNAVGRFVDSLVDPTRAASRAVATVGQVLPAPTPLACATAVTFTGFAPVFSLMSSGANRIIGFAALEYRRDPARPANPCAAIVFRSGSRVAPLNATANLMNGLPLPSTIDPVEVRELLDKNAERNGALAYGPLLVAALAR